MSTNSRQTRVVFLHPDLGIGGAERLVVDSALALQARMNDVTIITNHHDPTHCFPETLGDHFPIIVVGSWIPRSLFGKCHALMAYLRMIYAAFWLGLSPSAPVPDVVYVDQVSACIPVLNLFLTAYVLFFCHFPDQLLTDRKTTPKKLYRAAIDAIEECTTGMADLVLVNSKFTESVFQETFPSLVGKVHTAVLYPSLNMAAFNQQRLDDYISDIVKFDSKVQCYFLSLNRFERKKNLGLALKALKALHQKLKEDQRAVGLVVAGGYDPNLKENQEYLAELEKEAKTLGIEEYVNFVRSPDETIKMHLIHSCLAVVYTPQNEHFGIVPLEAMYLNRPVIAVNSGGPLETVKHRETGLLCDPTPAAFSEAMKELFLSRSFARDMGIQGHHHVKDNFSYDNFAHRLDGFVKGLSRSQRVREPLQAFITPVLFIAFSMFSLWLLLTGFVVLVKAL